jgi:hypothetical protein
MPVNKGEEFFILFFTSIGVEAFRFFQIDFFELLFLSQFSLERKIWFFNHPHKHQYLARLNFLIGF